MPARSRVRASMLGLVTLLAVPAIAAGAQNPANPAITLADALRMAEAHAPRLKARESEVRGAEDALHLGQARLLPSLDLGAQVARATDNNITGLMLPQSTIFPITGPVLPVSSGSTV